MVQVVEDGNEKFFEVVCENLSCLCTLRFQAKDILDEEGYGYEKIKCPKCGARTMLTIEKLLGR